MPKERKLEHTPHTIQNPYPSSPQPSSSQPRSCHPTIQNPSPSLPSNHFQKEKKKKKKKKKNQTLDREERVKPTRSRTQPQIAPPHLTPNRTGLIAPQHRRDRTQPLARSNQPLARLRRLKHRRDRTAWSTNEITPMTHSCPISLFLNIPLPFPQLSFTLVLPLSPFDRIFEFNECFVLIFVSFKFIYWNFLLWNLFEN